MSARPKPPSWWVDFAFVAAPASIAEMAGARGLAISLLIGVAAAAHANGQRVSHNERLTRWRFDRHAEQEHPR